MKRRPRRPVQDDAVTATLGTLLMLALALLLSIGVLAFSIYYTWESEDPGAYAFAHDRTRGTIEVQASPTGARWQDLDVDGCATVPTGPISAGDLLSGCAGRVTIVEIESRFLIVTFDFD